MRAPITARAPVALGAAFALILAQAPVARARPGNDDFADARRVDGRCMRVIGSLAGATYQDGEWREEGWGSVWFRWTAPSTNVVIIDFHDSPVTGSVALARGSSLASPRWVAGDATARGRSFRVRRGITYSIQIVGPISATRFVLNLDMARPPANDDFRDARSIEGNNGLLRTHSYGATREPWEPSQTDWLGAKRSIWFRWTAPRSGTWTFATLGSNFDTTIGVFVGDRLRRLRRVTVNDDAYTGRTSRAYIGTTQGLTYRIRVDGGFFGEAGEVALSWEPVVTAPRNDAFAHPEVIGGREGQIAGNTTWATHEVAEPWSAWRHTGSSVWFQWRAPASGPVAFDVQRSPSEARIAIYRGTRMTSLTLVARNRVDPYEDWVPYASFSAQAGTVYRIAIDGDWFETYYVLRWKQGRAPNDNFADAQPISGDSGRVVGDNRLATKEPGEGPSHPDTPVASVWYRWTAPATGPVSFDTVGRHVTTQLLVRTGSDPETYVTDDLHWEARVRFDAEAGRRYYIMVAGVEDTFTLRWRMAWSPDETPPTVTITSPLDQPQVARNVALTADASDDRGVDRVEFIGWMSGGAISFGLDASPPYEVEADISRFGDSFFNGPLHVMAYAYDSASNMQHSSPVAIDVDNWPSDTDMSPTGPWRRVRSTSATFRLRASDPNASFTCSVDFGPYSPCGSLVQLENLSYGTHVLRARAIDPAGHVDPTPITRLWTVARRAPC